MLDQAIERDQANAINYYQRGLAYEALDNMQIAIANYQKALSLNPNYPEPRTKLESLGAR
ncbi:MAG: tetratricopeptide repeat protein [Synechococcaceae cyanobacterium RL_1_2]|nr:tetratricopeptide repeat protein [Synechococcaceae cyanobacterium RL_1_2]